MKSKLGITLAAVAALLTLTVFFLTSRHHDSRTAPQTAAARSGTGDRVSLEDSGKNTGPAAQGTPSAAIPSVPMSAAAAEYLKNIESAWADLSSGDETKRKKALEALDQMLGREGQDAKAAVAAILEFLKSGKDAATGEPFAVGPNGLLSSASTLRVLLMDHLGTLSQEAKSNAALDTARDILSTKRSADEWAVSLRNVAWFDPDSRQFLHEKAVEMLNHQPWADQPSIGMMEAFDVMVHVGATDLIPTLGALSSQPESPLSRASAVALDRLAERNPGATAEYLLKHPEALEKTPLVRADLFAKANLGEPQQRQLLETYLAREDIGLEEKSKCLDSLAAPGSFISNNLLTPLPPPVDAESEARRVALLHSTLEQWIAADKFPALRKFMQDLSENTKPPQ